MLGEGLGWALERREVWEEAVRRGNAAVEEERLEGIEKWRVGDCSLARWGI